MKTVFVDPTGVFHWGDQRTIKGGGGGGVFANVTVETKGHTPSRILGLIAGSLDLVG